MQVAVVCLVALTSGNVLCKLDSERCKEFGDRGAGPAPSPLTQRGSGALHPHAASFHSTVQASSKPGMCAAFAIRHNA